jgi:hypothetical protein
MKRSEKNRSAHVEIGFNKRIVYHWDVLRRVRRISIWGPLIAENSYVVEVVEIRFSDLRVG